jgi:hypothetical protein
MTHRRQEKIPIITKKGKSHHHKIGSREFLSKTLEPLDIDINIGRELQVVKMQHLFQVRVDRIIAQITSYEHKLRAIIATFERIIITAFNQKLAPGA